MAHDQPRRRADRRGKVIGHAGGRLRPGAWAIAAADTARTAGDERCLCSGWAMSWAPFKEISVFRTEKEEAASQTDGSALRTQGLGHDQLGWYW